MAKEHKKLYKAGKNWVVATLTATTITLLGGIGAYTAHADTTAENNQSTETSNISQSSQSDNSSNSVVLTQPVTTQSNQTALSNQSEQRTPTTLTVTAATNNSSELDPNIYGTVQSSQNNNSNNSVVLNQLVTTQSNPTVQSTQFAQGNQVTQNYQNTPTVATSNVSINDSDELDPSSLWYKPPFEIDDGEVARSGLRDLDLHISDGINPNITIYISFFDSEKPEIQQYAHAESTRDIYIKDPQTGEESLARHDVVLLNRWVAVDTTRNNEVVGLGPWVVSLISPKSFPYNIPQKNGYTSYCNGKKATMIDEEQFSGNPTYEIYHITYVPTSSLVDKKTRTIIIKFPDGKQESTIQNTVLSDDSTCIWPKYVIPARDGYDSYVGGLKASVIPEQTVDVNDDDNVVVNVTYQKSPTPSTPDEKVKHQRKTITRTILVYNINGQFSNSIDQTVNYTRDYIINGLGDKIFLGDWSPDGNGTWDEYIIPQYEGYKSQVDSKDATVVPSQYVNLNDKDVTIDVTYKKVPSKGQHKAITRTIKITDPSGYVQTIPQTVNYTYHVIKIGSETLVGWVADTNDSWDEYAIPQHKGFISQVDSKDATVVPSQHVNSNDKNVIINVTYKKAPATSTSKQYKTLTRIISIHDINNIVGITQITQTVNYTRNIVTDAQGNIVSYTDWVVDGNDTWDEYAVPQQVGFISQVDSKDATIVPSQHVNPNDKNMIINVTYKKDPTMLTSKTITRTIHIFDINGQFSKTISQAVNYTRYWGSTGFGNEGFSDWEADGNDTWDEYAIPQHEGYKSQVNSKDATVIPSQHVTSNDKDIDITVTYIKTDNSKGNGNVDDNNNPSRLNNEVPYDSTTISNNVNANYGYLDSYKLTENNQGQAQLIASGWHATGASNSDRYRYMIVFDNTLGHEIARQKLVPQVRSDVQRAYSNVDNSLYSGFNVTIDIPNSCINHSLRLVSRYSNDPNHGEGARVDYWFNSLALNEDNQAYLDKLSANGDTLTVTGWHATNQAAGRPYHYIIAWDRNLGHEIARQRVTAVSRPDVAKAYSTVANAVNSGFSVKFNLTPQFFNDNIQFISRWTDDAAGNGNAVDYWFKPMNRTNRANLDSVTLSNGQVKVAGWHATDLSQLEPNHYLIVFDNTTGQQVASEKVGLQSSQDVKNVFGDIQTANHSRFNYAFDGLHLVSGHNYSLVSRYSADANGNGNDGAHTDSWLNMGTFQQSAYSIDHVALNRRHMTVQGWVANDNAMTRPYAYAILLQNGHEIGRQRLNLSERADVAKVYPQIYRSQYSGFNTSFDLPTASTNGLQLVLRFTDDPAGNGNSSDQWIKLNKFSLAD